jgi:Coenzyme PQQ synthesis protein D (PqqD)
MSVPIALASRIVLSKDQVSCDLAGEAAILNVKSGVYFGLDPIGARIWHLIKQHGRVDAVRDAILAEYDVEPARCEADLLALLSRMAEAGLIEVDL